MIRLIGILVLLAGCSTLGKASGGAGLAIETVADQIRIECGNTVPDGPCTPESRITTEEKAGLKASLEEAVRMLELADAAVMTGQAETAAMRLRQSEGVVAAIARLLESRGIR